MAALPSDFAQTQVNSTARGRPARSLATRASKPVAGEEVASPRRPDRRRFRPPRDRPDRAAAAAAGASCAIGVEALAAGEIGHDQGDAVTDLLARDGLRAEVANDLAGLRAVLLTWV